MSKSARGRKPLSEDELNLTREHILKAAHALFAKQGYKAISMRTLADAVDMSPTSLYRFYPNKRAILIYIWGEVFGALLKDCKQAAQQVDGSRQALIAYADCFVAYWLAHPDIYMMVYGEIDSPVKGESFFADSALVSDAMAYLTSLLIKAGVAQADLELTLQQLICIMHGVAHSLVTIPELNWHDAKSITGGLVDSLIP